MAIIEVAYLSTNTVILLADTARFKLRQRARK